jgi:hypothetical protein
MNFLPVFTAMMCNAMQKILNNQLKYASMVLRSGNRIVIGTLAELVALEQIKREYAGSIDEFGDMYKQIDNINLL